MKNEIVYYECYSIWYTKIEMVKFTTMESGYEEICDGTRMWTVCVYIYIHGVWSVWKIARVFDWIENSLEKIVFFSLNEMDKKIYNDKPTYNVNFYNEFFFFFYLENETLERQWAFFTIYEFFRE